MRVVAKTPVFRILRDVASALHVIFGVANLVLVESTLPDSVTSFDGMSESSLDALHAAIDGVIVRGRDERVHVIGHDHKGMEEIAAFVAKVKGQLRQQGGVILILQERAAPGDSDGNEVCVRKRAHRCPRVAWVPNFSLDNESLVRRKKNALYG
jgi:low affinity Fe/Cu permease